MRQGVYPLWDTLWSIGSPNEFFLRRIGPFNPLLLLILIPYKLGVNYWYAFSCFLAFYYFLGMFGFYKIACEILKDKTLAFGAFVLLSFSSLGTRVFDSYVMMLMTPMIWFFYFLMMFGRSGKKSDFLGAVFCVLLLTTTYIPFYFLTLALSFAVFFILVYPVEFKNFLIHAVRFILRNPFLFLICVGGLALSCVPGLLFFKGAGQGNFTMPLRHFDSTQVNVLSVKPDVTTYWAIPEDLLYSTFYLVDLRLFDFAIFYIPLLAYMIFLLGIVTKINRKIFLFVTWGSFLLLLGSPFLVPLYNYLHEYIFFFKYFRNLHFFLWLAVLPLFILMVLEQLRLLKEMVSTHIGQKIMVYALIFVAHGGMAIFLIWRESLNYSTWINLALSFVFCILYFSKKVSRFILLTFLFAAAVTQPLETYYHLSQNFPKEPSAGVYDRFSPKVFHYTLSDDLFNMISGSKLPGEREDVNRPIYFGTQWFTALWENINYYALKNYTHHKFILYDHVKVFDEQKESVKTLEKAWSENQNIAFVSSDYQEDLPQSKSVIASPGPLKIEEASDQFRVLHQDVNSLIIKSNIPARKFLVFNNGYYPGWKVFINGRESKLYRTNVAFRGVWIPAGEQRIEFKYEKRGHYALEISLVMFYLAFFIYFIWTWRKENLQETDWADHVRNI